MAMLHLQLYRTFVPLTKEKGGGVALPRGPSIEVVVVVVVILIIITVYYQ